MDTPGPQKRGAGQSGTAWEARQGHTGGVSEGADVLQTLGLSPEA